MMPASACRSVRRMARFRQRARTAVGATVESVTIGKLMVDPASLTWASQPRGRAQVSRLFGFEPGHEVAVASLDQSG